MRTLLSFTSKKIKRERCVRFNLGGKQNGRIHEGIEKIP
jgi:hypothetical protein